jgi:hypothetical protein
MAARQQFAADLGVGLQAAAGQVGRSMEPL